MGVRCKRRVQGGAWAVQGGGKVRDRCVGRVGRMGCEQGWVGSASVAPRVDLALLVHASKNKRKKVTSDLQVPGPSRSWGPVSATPADHRVCARACTCRRVLAPQEKGCPALLGKSCVALRSKAWARLFLPARARRPGWSVTHRSAGAAPSRNGRLSFAARTRARPVPGILKAWHLPNCDETTSRPPRKKRYRLTLFNVLTMPRGKSIPQRSPPSPHRIVRPV